MLNKIKIQTGVSLIESMVALVIISVGLLGIAALQIVAIQQTSSSQWHSKAVWYSYEMSDRILANPAQFANYSGVDTNNDYAQDCQIAACLPAQLLTSDAADWKQRVSDLPSGQGVIRASATGLTVMVLWDDEGTGAIGTGCSSDPRIDLTCYSVTLVQ